MISQVIQQFAQNPLKFRIIDTLYESERSLVQSIKLRGCTDTTDTLVLKLFKEKEKHQIETEIEILTHLNKEDQKHVIKLLTCYQVETSFIFLYKEYFSSLFEDLPSIGLCYEETLDMSKQIFSILSYLKKHKIIHNDIKPHNFLLDADNTLTLTDFEFSCHEEKISDINPRKGTPMYMSPERLLYKHLVDGYSSDLWSAAATIYTIATCSYAFQGTLYTDIQKLHQIRLGTSYPKEFPSDALLIEQDCLDKQPKENLLINRLKISLQSKKDFSKETLIQLDQFTSLLLKIFVFDPPSRISIEEALELIPSYEKS